MNNVSTYYCNKAVQKLHFQFTVDATVQDQVKWLTQNVRFNRKIQVQFLC